MLGGLSFIVGDGRELPFDSASFDAVVCHTSLCHIAEPEQVLAEAARVTVEGGLLAVFDGHGYVESSDPSYMLTIVDRGADALVTARRIGEDAAAALKDESRRRVAEGRLFGHIAYVSAIGMRPTPEVMEQPR